MLDICAKTLANWEASHPDFLQALSKGLQNTEIALSNGALSGAMNATFSGLVAANILGWRSSKSEVTATVEITERPAELVKQAIESIR